MAHDLSGTDAIDFIRAALRIQDHETLEEAAQRAIATYLGSPSVVVDYATVERAMVAYSLRLDEAPDERSLKWAHVFQAAQIAVSLLERERRDAQLEHSGLE